MKNQIYNLKEKHMDDNQSSNIIKKLQSDLENTQKYINELILDLNDLSETLPESLKVMSLLENTKTSARILQI
mgnify:CR=1 FL=1